MNAFAFRGRRIRRATTAGLALALAGLAVSGCSDARKALGWDKSPPDEFRIVSRAPLALPPDYGLRPPAPGTPRPQELTVPEQARQAVVGSVGPRTPVTSSAAASPGESALLAKIGATRSDPRIRETVDRESQTLAEADRTFLERITFWQKPQEPGVVVDPEREAQRLRENQALGRPVTDGDTPTIRRRKRGMLEGIF